MQASKAPAIAGAMSYYTEGQSHQYIVLLFHLKIRNSSRLKNQTAGIQFCDVNAMPLSRNGLWPSGVAATETLVARAKERKQRAKGFMA